jgi:hypothetical protein
VLTGVHELGFLMYPFWFYCMLKHLGGYFRLGDFVKPLVNLAVGSTPDLLPKGVEV